MSGSMQRHSFVRGRKSKFGAEQVQGWPWTQDLRFHRAMLFRSSEVNPAEGYPRPPEFNGRAIATGTE